MWKINKCCVLKFDCTQNCPLHFSGISISCNGKQNKLSLVHWWPFVIHVGRPPTPNERLKKRNNSRRLPVYALWTVDEPSVVGCALSGSVPKPKAKTSQVSKVRGDLVTIRIITAEMNPEKSPQQLLPHCCSKQRPTASRQGDTQKMDHQYQTHL